MEEPAQLPRVLSQNSGERCSRVVDALSEALVDTKSRETGLDLETVFRAQYGRIVRVIARVIRDPARAEELGVEVFLKFARSRKAQRENVEGWLYRTAVRTSLNELRRLIRQERYERLVAMVRRTPTPEELLAAREEQDRVRRLLGAMDPRQAEMLVLRNQGFSYEELATALQMNPASVGTLLSRAQQAFRKEYLKRYGQQS
jgi:RNA polymerase sigma-70 factor (ECF subfamily)